MYRIRNQQTHVRASAVSHARAVEDPLHQNHAILRYCAMAKEDSKYNSFVTNFLGGGFHAKDEFELFVKWKGATSCHTAPDDDSAVNLPSSSSSSGSPQFPFAKQPSPF